MNDKLCNKKDCPNYFYPKEEDLEKEDLEKDQNLLEKEVNFSPSSSYAMFSNNYPYSHRTMTVPYVTTTATVGCVDVWDTNIIQNKENFTLKIKCIDEFVPIECFLCSKLKKIDMSVLLTVYKAKEELKK